MRLVGPETSSWSNPVRSVLPFAALAQPSSRMATRLSGERYTRIAADTVVSLRQKAGVHPLRERITASGGAGSRLLG